MIALDCIASSFQPATCLALRKELATSALSCASKNSSIRCLWWMEHMRASISWWRVAFTHQLAAHAHSRLQFAWCRSHHERQLDWSRLASIHKHLMQLPCAFVIAKFSSTVPAWKKATTEMVHMFSIVPKANHIGALGSCHMRGRCFFFRLTSGLMEGDSSSFISSVYIFLWPSQCPLLSISDTVFCLNIGTWNTSTPPLIVKVPPTDTFILVT